MSKLPDGKMIGEPETNGRGRRVAPGHPFERFEPAAVERSIAERFEQQARRHGTRTAVKSAQHELTYDALNRAANQLAHALLQERGAGAEPVGLLLEHGAPMVTALLAVLKTGKFYVPLDPTYPTDRLTCLLEDSQAGILLTSSALVDRARDLAGPERCVLVIDTLPADLSTENPRLPIAPDAFAYVIYTSGSTGQPKGVVENQRNLLHVIMVRTNSAHIVPDDRLALLQSVSFSGSVTLLFCALLNGAALHLLAVKETGPAQLASWLVHEQISVWSSVPSTFRQLVSTLQGDERFPKLRLVHLGGEPLYRKDVELYRQHFADECILLNTIGSAEVRVFAEYFLDQHSAIDGGLVPVGYPVDDTEILLLGDDGQPVGDEAVGEIVVKTRFVAPAYWRQPELTRTTFQPAPDGTDERLYRTGDLGRLLLDGCLVHLGRKDSQVKIRGHRIESGEVEAALLNLPGIREAVVVPREDEPGDQRLVAYIVPNGAEAPRSDGLRRALAATLPDYLLPAVFVILEALPKNSSGKIDRLSLPEPDPVRPRLDVPYAPPRSHIESVLAAIWADVLKLDRIGIFDEFIALGGDSLRATRLAARARDAFALGVPLAAFLESSTVADQAETVVRHLAAATADVDLDALLTQPGDRE